jgi:hypothetical protein
VQVSRQAEGPNFQAGHAGSIPVIRSSSTRLIAFDSTNMHPFRTARARSMQDADDQLKRFTDDAA